MTAEIVKQYWNNYCDSDDSVDPGTEFQVWYFGNSREMALELLDLVLIGKKTATASSVAMNELDPGNAPFVGGYSVVTDFDGEPRCIVRTVDVRHITFDEVDAEFAADEGEGDLSLEYWRRVHHDYFSREALKHGFDFNDRSIICCERFVRLFPR